MTQNEFLSLAERYVMMGLDMLTEAVRAGHVRKMTLIKVRRELEKAEIYATDEHETSDAK